MRYSIFLGLLAISISSCQYRKTNRRHHLVQSNYSDSIYIENVIICANTFNFFLRDEYKVLNRDSTFNVFLSSFEKLPIKVKVNRGNFYCDKSFIPKYRLRYRNFSLPMLKTLIKEQNSPVLIPLISYNYIARRNNFITSTGGIGGDGGFIKNVHIELAILIFFNQELVYFSSRFYSTEAVIVNRYYESIDFSIKQENIDTLVQLTMKDYLERMK